ncbi:MAG: hypothetical protein R2875_10850 [Desulfobacterales bacterium]
MKHPVADYRLWRGTHGQPGLSDKLLKALRQKGIHTALDTCGLCRRSALDQCCDSPMVLFDIKLMDPVAHEKFTGYDNHRILENLVYVSDYMQSHVHPSEMCGFGPR